ncbi:MAG: 8-oxo-dGTP diphosphatase MutT [Pseudomonadota bacterium]
MSESVCVVAGVILDPTHQKVLVARRNRKQHQGGLWEYPGGKCESDEPLRDALARELHEELGIRVGDAEPLLRVDHSYPDKQVELHFFVVRSFSGQAAGREGQRVKWVGVAELDELAFPSANAPVAGALRTWLQGHA